MGFGAHLGLLGAISTNFFSQWLLDIVIIVVVLLLCIHIVHFNYKFGLGNNPYPLNYGKYPGIALKIIVRSTIGTPK